METLEEWAKRHERIATGEDALMYHRVQKLVRLARQAAWHRAPEAHEELQVFLQAVTGESGQEPML